MFQSKKIPILKIENKINIKNMRLQKLHTKNKEKTFLLHTPNLKEFIEKLEVIKKQLTLLEKGECINVENSENNLSTFYLEDLFIIKNKNKSIFTNDLIITDFLRLRENILFLIHQKITTHNSASSDANRRLLTYILKDVETLYSYLSDLEI